MVPEILPRWEWRTFGDRFGRAESAFAGLSPSAVVESDELYLISAAGAETVKLRDQLMDVKHLLQVDDDGLEQWIPVMKAAFPLSSADVAEVLAALGVDAPSPLSRRRTRSSALLEEVVAPTRTSLPSRCTRGGSGYTIGGCLAELTDVRTERASTRTLAIESEDASRVIATARELGLAPRPNVNFVRGLKALVGFGIERFAVIDVGTNSVKFHIGERGADGGWRTIVDHAEVTRLGDGLQETGRLNPEPMARTVEAIAGMAEEARRHRVAAIAAVGTAGLRIAPDAVDFIDAVQARCGVSVEIISGEDEARLAYPAATAGLGAQGRGSSSTPAAVARSSPSVRATGWMSGSASRWARCASPSSTACDGLVTQDVLSAALAAIEADLVRLDGRAAPEALVGLGGAVTNLAGVKHGLAEYDPDVVQGTVLDRAEIDRQIELYRTRSAGERREIVGLQPRRADIILAGACIVRTVLGKLGSESLTVSDRGLRHGILAEKFGLAVTGRGGA